MHLADTQFGTYGDRLVQYFFDNEITDITTLNAQYRLLCRMTHPDCSQSSDAHDGTLGLNAARDYVELRLKKTLTLFDEALLPRKARRQIAVLRFRCKYALRAEERQYLKKLKDPDCPADTHYEHYENEQKIRSQYDQQTQRVLISCTC